MHNVILLCVVPLHPSISESLDMAETSSHLFVHELSPQGLYLSCQVQVSERRALKPPKKGKQKLLDTSVSV